MVREDPIFDETIVVPLRLEGVIVGHVAFGENGIVTGTITSGTTHAFLRELFATHAAETLTISPDYTSAYEAQLNRHGRDHLRIVQNAPAQQNTLKENIDNA